MHHANFCSWSCNTLLPQFQALKNDFHYNLGLLDERDQDLERYEQLLQDASIASAEKEELLSQMRSELIQLQSGMLFDFHCCM